MGRQMSDLIDTEMKRQMDIAKEREGVWTFCNNCNHRFKLLYDDYGNTEPMTVEIGYCLSGGIYSVSVKCPKCKHEESIK